MVDQEGQRVDLGLVLEIRLLFQSKEEHAPDHRSERNSMAETVVGLVDRAVDLTCDAEEGGK